MLCLCGEGEGGRCLPVVLVPFVFVLSSHQHVHETVLGLTFRISNEAFFQGRIERLRTMVGSSALRVHNPYTHMHACTHTHMHARAHTQCKVDLSPSQLFSRCLYLVNTSAAEMLYKKAREWCGVNPSSTLYGEGITLHTTN